MATKAGSAGSFGASSSSPLISATAPTPEEPPAARSRADVEAGGTGGEEERVCRICFEREDPAQAHDNPLISPCLCAGGSRYIHRKCLQQWRQACQGTARERARFRCEVCHFEYKFRRLDHAAFLAHPATVLTAFVLALVLTCFLLGFIPLVKGLLALNDVDALPAGAYWLLHFFDGALVLGLISFAVLLFTGTLSRSLQGCSCGGVGTSCTDCGGLSAAGGGAECGPLLLVVLAGVALLGLLAMIPLVIRILFDKANELAEAAVVMVENVQRPAAAGNDKKKSKQGAASAAAPRGTASGTAQQQAGLQGAEESQRLLE